LTYGPVLQSNQKHMLILEKLIWRALNFGRALRRRGSQFVKGEQDHNLVKGEQSIWLGEIM
jgi:hypothetical protein